MNEYIDAGWITCGADHPDPEIAAALRRMREEAGYPTEGGCGKRMCWTLAFRCVECGRWMHRDCIRKHFQESKHDQVA
jgi:hypothetical protein